MSITTDIVKIAAIKTQLQDHQQRVVDKMKTQRGLVLAHEPGVGKTLASLAISDSLNMPANVITPASLKTNYKKEYDKHTLNGPKIHQEGLENLARKGNLPNVEARSNPLLIVDEAHNIRTPGSKSLAAVKKLNTKAEKTVLLTGTPMYNGPHDIAPLVNIVANDKLLPENKSEFDKKYIFEKKVRPSFFNSLRGIKPGVVSVLNKHEKSNLQNILNTWVDYQESSKDNFPTVEEQEIKVPMTDKQLATYDSLLGTAPAWVAAKIRSGLPPDKKECKDLNAFASAIRQISNTTQPFIPQDQIGESPKIQRAFDELKTILDKDPGNKGVVYSNFLEAGINPYKALLDKAKIPYGEFTGQVDPATRDQMVKDYNDNKLKALLLSSAGSSGLDLKGSTVMQLLDPHFNDSKLDQAQARAIRFGSHAHLDPEKRKVLVQRFLATRPEKGLLDRIGLTKPGGAVDEYLMMLSKHKTDLSNQFTDLMRGNGLQEKVAKIEDDVNKFLKTPDYKFLLTKLPSSKFSTVLASKVEDSNLKNFINNNHKHLSALRKNRGVTQVESQTDKTKKYSVIKHKGGTYTCDCKDYIYKQAPINSECKHIKSLEKTAAAYVSHHQQSNQRNCSAACMKMVCDYYGISKTEDECAKLIGVHKCGAENYEVADAINKVGLQTINKELSPEEVKKYLDKGYPIIMDAKSYNYKNKFHYTVLADLDVEKDVAIIFDPNYDKKIRTLTLKELDDVWHSNEMYRPNKPLVRQGIVVFTRQH